jgi:hypothetical protein
MLPGMNTDALPEGWEILRDWLPDDLNERARKHGFFQRARGLQDAERWLRLILMHVSGGLSLEQSALRARELGLASVSGVALFKRLRRAQGWLADLTTWLLKEQRRRLGRFVWPYAYRLRVIDATDIQEPGSTGTDWRLHFSIRLPEMLCDHYELTDETGGEQLGRFQFAPDELVLADRGYSHRAGAAQVLHAGAHVVLRWNPQIFPLESEDEELEVLPKLRRLRTGEFGEWAVSFIHAQRRYRLRLCALRKSRTATERARRKARRKAQLKGSQPTARSLELAAYVLVLTSAPARTLPTRAVLDLYRGRWQVELVFKRLKSLLDAGQVPKSQDQSARAWMQAKILTALLLDRVILEGKFFSPWGYPLRLSEPLASIPGDS